MHVHAVSGAVHACLPVCAATHYGQGLASSNHDSMTGEVILSASHTAI